MQQKKFLRIIPVLLIMGTSVLFAQGVTEDGILPGAENVLTTEEHVYQWIPLHILIETLEYDEQGNYISPLTDEEADTLMESENLSDKSMDQLRLYKYLERQEKIKENLIYRRNR